ncbi:MAG: hypothetical protein WCW67_03850 [Candidatus Margulisiibacteriota bacterium]
MIARSCRLSGERAVELYKKIEFNDQAARQAMAGRVAEAHQGKPFPEFLAAPFGRSCLPREIYFQPEKRLALTDPLYWEALAPEKLAQEHLHTIAFPSQSDRAMVIIWDNGAVSEFKGETLPSSYLKSAGVHDQSQEPYGFLEAVKGEREAECLREIGAIDSQFTPLGEGEDAWGRHLGFGQLVREGEAFFPWLRLDRPLADLCHFSRWQKLSLETFLQQTAGRLGGQLAKLHANGCFNVGYRSMGNYFKGILSYCHVGNVEINGNLLDLGTVKRGAELAQLYEDWGEGKKSAEEQSLFSAFLDIYRIFGGIYPPTGNFLWGLDRGLLGREWDAYSFDLFLKAFAESYLKNTAQVGSFMANWHNSQKMMAVLNGNQE